MIVIVPFSQSGFSYEELLKLIHESFQERLDQGLEFTCSAMTVEQFKVRMKDGVVFVAVDSSSQSLIGTLSCHLFMGKSIHGYIEYLAIRPDYKRQGVGTLLYNEIERFALDKKASYFESDTAVRAKSSVRWHIDLGFKIIGLNSYSSTNYYSYIFRKQLSSKCSIWDSTFFCYFHFFVSSLYVILLKRKDGRLSILGRAVKKVYQFLRS